METSLIHYSINDRRYFGVETTEDTMCGLLHPGTRPSGRSRQLFDRDNASTILLRKRMRVTTLLRIRKNGKDCLYLSTWRGQNESIGSIRSFEEIYFSRNPLDSENHPYGDRKIESIEENRSGPRMIAGSQGKHT